jgi:hypothetical protein
MDMPRLGLGFQVQKRTVFLSSWWWGFSICTERRDAHEQALVVLRGKRIREKRKLLLLLKIWNEAWK